jgi:Hemocyanin, all-alpha domain.
VKEFIALYKKGLVKRWQPFSLYYKNHLKQAISLFELFYFANDFDTFYKVRDVPCHLSRNSKTTDTSLYKVTDTEKQ